MKLPLHSLNEQIPTPFGTLQCDNSPRQFLPFPVAMNKTINQSTIGNSTSSPLVSNAIKRNRTNNRAEKHQNRKEIMQEKRRRQTIMSPSQAASPKAQPSLRLKSPASSKVLQGNFSTVAAASSSNITSSPSSAGNGLGNSYDSPRPLLTIASGKGLSIDQMNSTFQEWMKLVAADNKINAKNSWSLALIDYFSDLTLLKDGDSINFERASCTLDGCIKIYTSRVDCVADETGKLLSGLLEEKNPRESQEQEISTSSTANNACLLGTNLKKKKSIISHSGCTLERNPEALNCTKKEQSQPFSLAMSKRMLAASNAESGEGNAKRGWLLGNIQISSKGFLTLLAEGEECQDDEWENDDEDDEICLNLTNTQAFSQIQHQTLIPSLPPMEKELKSEQEIRSKIEHLSSLTIDLNDDNFIFNDQNVLLPHSNRRESSNLNSEEMQLDSISTEENSIEEMNDFGGFSEQVLEAPNAAEELELHSASTPEPEVEPEQILEEISTQNHNNLAGSMLELSLETTAKVQEAKEHQIDSSAFERANANFASSWAGPQHWKIKKQISAFSSQNSRFLTQSSASSSSSQQKQQTSKTRLSKEEAQAKKCFVDFANYKLPDLDALFAKGNLGHLSEEALSKSSNLLPEDFQITAKQMFSLFLKPKCKISSLKKGALGKEEEQNSNQRIEKPIQDEFSGEMPVENGDFGGSEQFQEEYSYEQQSFVTQEQQQQQQQLQNAVSKENPHSSPQVMAMLKIKPSQQKNVDIQALKKRIWNEISSRKSQGIKVFPFHSISDSLANEFSKAFCFICLLHLANEEGFCLENDESTNKLLIKF